MARRPLKDLDDAGEKIKAAIQAQGMTQAQVAAKAGIDIGTVSHIINGTRRSTFSVNKLLQALGLSYDFVFLCIEPQAEGTARPAKVVGEISPNDQVSTTMHFLEQWIREQDDPFELSMHLRREIKKIYPEFAEWIKKSEKDGECDTAQDRKSAGGME